MSDGASGSIQLSETTPVRLIQSTGNLYWSSNAAGMIAASIFRASKSSQPGEEVQLYAEGGAVTFGALTFAMVDGYLFYGYFVANYPQESADDPFVSYIKSIQLSGSGADILTVSAGTIGLGDLVTDGSFLCWADRDGIWSMPIGGGPLTTLVAGTGFARLSVLGGTLYYIDGTAIDSVPMGGGTPSNVVTEQLSPITALHVLAAQPPAALAERPEMSGLPIVQDVALVWGRADGAVCGMFRGETTTYQEPTANTTVSSVYSIEGRVLWKNEHVSTGGEAGSVQVLMSYGGVTTTLSSMAATSSNGDLMADEAAAYWTGDYVEKYTF
jgi:hypothetical protein